MKMKKAVVYIHGKGGTAEEAEHYKILFPKYDVIGFEYRAQTPWEAVEEFPAFFESVRTSYSSISLIANSLGAYFALISLGSVFLEKAFFISPVVDMEKLIVNMMQWAGVTECELEKNGTIETDFGETLSFDYLRWVRQHSVSWNTRTFVLYGNKDNMQSADTIRTFAENSCAELTIMENGEHWFHTEEQMAFLDSWISRSCDDYQHIVHPFPPLYDSESTILILGSFPSVKSREQNFFYGHPQNRFWKVLAAVFNDEIPVTIEEKKNFLHKHHVAVWDVIYSCDIIGSSDSSIKNAEPTDIRKIIEGSKVTRIFTNGKTAGSMYEKYQKKLVGMEAVTMPSTSPANAAFSLEKLTESWKVIIQS